MVYTSISARLSKKLGERSELPTLVYVGRNTPDNDKTRLSYRLYNKTLSTSSKTSK